MHLFYCRNVGGGAERGPPSSWTANTERYHNMTKSLLITLKQMHVHMHNSAEVVFCRDPRKKKRTKQTGPSDYETRCMNILV